MLAVTQPKLSHLGKIRTQTEVRCRRAPSVSGFHSIIKMEVARVIFLPPAFLAAKQSCIGLTHRGLPKTTSNSSVSILTVRLPLPTPKEVGIRRPMRGAFLRPRLAAKPRAAASVPNQKVSVRMQFPNPLTTRWQPLSRWAGSASCACDVRSKRSETIRRKGGDEVPSPPFSTQDNSLPGYFTTDRMVERPTLPIAS